MKNVSAPIMSAPARSWAKVAKTVSKSRSAVALRTWSLSPSLLAAGCASRDKASARVRLVGLTSRAIVVAVGTNWCSSSSCFAPTSTLRLVTPVRLLPGRFRLATSPTATGSNPISKTIGIVAVAAFAATAEGVPVVAMTAT
jgi:hypothetical protein